MNRISRQSIGWLGGAAVLAVVLGATNASATVTTYGPNDCLNSTGTDCHMQLDVGNPLAGGSGLTPAYPGPYVDINVSIISTEELQFKLTSDTQNIAGKEYIYLFDNIALYFSDTHFASTPGTFISASKDEKGNTIYAKDVTFGGAIGEDGFGIANSFGNTSVSVEHCAPAGHPCDNGYNSGLSQLTFDVTWADANWTDLRSQELLYRGGHGGNAQGLGASAAGHIYATTFITNPLGNPVYGTSAAATGYAAWGSACDQGIGPGCTNVRVPEPASLAILATGLVGLGLLRRRRRLAQS